MDRIGDSGMTKRSDESHLVGGWPDDVPDRLAELLSGWIDNDLTADDGAKLRQWCDDDPRVLRMMQGMEAAGRHLHALPPAWPSDVADGLPEAADQRIRAALGAVVDESPDPPGGSYVPETTTGGRHRPAHLVGSGGGPHFASLVGRVGGVRGVAIAALVVVVVAVLVASALIVSKRTDSDRAPEVVVPTADAPQVDKQLFRDDFTGGSLDNEKWNPPDRPALIGVTDGALRFRLDGDQLGDLNTELAPKFGQSFREISVQAIVTDVERYTSGGVALNVTSGSGRAYQLGLGPSGSAQPVGGVGCAEASCALAVALIRPPLGGIDVGRPFTVRAVDMGSRLQFSIDDRPPVDGPTDSSGMADFTLSMTGVEHDSWDVLVNNVTVLA